MVGLRTGTERSSFLVGIAGQKRIWLSIAHPENIEIDLSISRSKLHRQKLEMWEEIVCKKKRFDVIGNWGHERCRFDSVLSLVDPPATP